MLCERPFHDHSHKVHPELVMFFASSTLVSYIVTPLFLISISDVNTNLLIQSTFWSLTSNLLNNDTLCEVGCPTGPWVVLDTSRFPSRRVHHLSLRRDDRGAFIKTPMSKVHHFGRSVGGPSSFSPLAGWLLSNNIHIRSWQHAVIIGGKTPSALTDMFYERGLGFRVKKEQ